jgi:hypothetical protein
MKEIMKLPGGAEVMRDTGAVYDVFVGERLVFVLGMRCTLFAPKRYYLWLVPFDLQRRDIRALKHLADEYLPQNCWATVRHGTTKTHRFAEFFGFKRIGETNETSAWSNF